MNDRQEQQEMDLEEKKYWVEFWHRGAYAIKKLDKLAYCLNIMNQLRMNGVGVDIHIQDVSPSISGWLTTSAGPVGKFKSIEELEIYLVATLESIRPSKEG